MIIGSRIGESANNDEEVLLIPASGLFTVLLYVSVSNIDFNSHWSHDQLKVAVKNRNSFYKTLESGVLNHQRLTTRRQKEKGDSERTKY